MASAISPATRIYRRASAHFAALREALRCGGFHAVTPPDALADWECVDSDGTRVRCGGTFVLLEAASEAKASAFDAQYRIAFPSEHEIPDGGAAPEIITSIAGSDESGKGDRAHALVVAAVLVPCAREPEAFARGVRDSKACNPQEVRELARWIEDEYACEVRVVLPEAREHALRLHGGNESRLLTAMHAECLRALRLRQTFVLARVDRFAPGRPVAAQLARDWSDIVIDECVRGEQHVAVAAASIVARQLARM
jgi:ribonuclease HIII